jgi:hypothetical protein
MRCFTLSERELAHGLACEGADLEHVHEHLQAMPVPLAVHVVDGAQQPETVHRRQVEPKLRFLPEYGAYAVAQLHAVARWIEAQHVHIAGGGEEYARQHLDRGGLAGAVRADERDDLALLHGEAHVAHGRNLLIVACEQRLQARPETFLLHARTVRFRKALHADRRHWPHLKNNIAEVNG